MLMHTAHAPCTCRFGISVPLVFLGAYLGFRRPPIEYPTKTNLIPRRVPERPWYMHPIFCVLVGGVLPFGAVFIELFFILSSIWLHQARSGTCTLDMHTCHAHLTCTLDMHTCTCTRVHAHVYMYMEARGEHPSRHTHLPTSR